MSDLDEATVADYLRLAARTRNKSLQARWLRFADEAWANQPPYAVPEIAPPRDHSGTAHNDDLDDFGWADLAAQPGPLTGREALGCIVLAVTLGGYFLLLLYAAIRVAVAIGRSIGTIR